MSNTQFVSEYINVLGRAEKYTLFYNLEYCEEIQRKLEEQEKDNVKYRVKSLWENYYIEVYEIDEDGSEYIFGRL